MRVLVQCGCRHTLVCFSFLSHLYFSPDKTSLDHYLYQMIRRNDRFYEDDFWAAFIEPMFDRWDQKKGGFETILSKLYFSKRNSILCTFYSLIIVFRKSFYEFGSLYPSINISERVLFVHVCKYVSLCERKCGGGL